VCVTDVLKEKFNPQHYEFLIQGIKNWKRPGELPKCKIDWMPKVAWETLNRLVTIEPFAKLLPDIEASPNRFKEWYNKNRPEVAALPLEWRNKDDKEPFQKLMIVRALRPDRMTAALEHYVNLVLPNGKSYTECDAGKSFQVK
jgi:dynein heavy chain